MAKAKVHNKKFSMKDSSVTIAIIVLVLIIAAVIIILRGVSPPSVVNIDEEFARCLGSKSTLYVLTTCTHCRDQEEMFGDNIQYLDIIKCDIERDKCLNITAVPTWIINGEEVVGVQTIDELKNLSGC
jgi:glutaredoxin